MVTIRQKQGIKQRIESMGRVRTADLTCMKGVSGETRNLYRLVRGEKVSEKNGKLLLSILRLLGEQITVTEVEQRLNDLEKSNPAGTHHHHY